jgi:hypothetical protein
METVEVLPDPVSLIASMRAVGYTAETAVADLIDNSISAGASLIEVKYDASDSPFVAILDNGQGMDPKELRSAMRHGSRNPMEHRTASDLGRFGLGLKTASLSQCRKFTVVSKKGGKINALRWDLSVVEDLKQWLVVVPTKQDLSCLPLYSKLQGIQSGTLVVWEELDRLVAGAPNPQSEMTTKLAPLFDHLALVFHRFTHREEGHGVVEILCNGLKVPHRDPYLKENTFRQPLEGQTIRHERGDVTVTPFVLPPISHLSVEEIEHAGGREGLRGTQGFYVYRNRRLVIWGTWFKLVPKDEFFKLTRVQVDIPNSFDDLWALDIKKSAAYPPEAIRNRLKDLIPHFANTSRKTITHPGRVIAQGKFVPLWNKVEPRHGSFRYELNTEHPAIQMVSAKFPPEHQREFQALLALFGDSLPFESIYAEMCSDRRNVSESHLFASLLEIGANLCSVTGYPIEQIVNVDPLVRYPHFHDRLRAELEK